MKQNQKILSIMLILLVIFSSTNILFGQKAKAAGEVLLTVEPSAARVSPGSPFTVNILVDSNGNEVATIDFRNAYFEFDPSLVQVDSATMGADVDPGLSYSGNIDNITGRVTAIYGISGDIVDFTYPSAGNFIFVTFNMTAKNAVSGTSYLRIYPTSNDIEIADLTFAPPYHNHIENNSSIIANDDMISPIISQTTPVSTPTNDNTPNYIFTSDEAGTITYGGDCTSATTSAVIGANTITFNTLADGTHSNCTITVTDIASNASNLLTVTAFTVDTDPPATTISGIDISADTGTSDSDFLTQTATQTITATLSATLAADEILYGSVDAGANYTDITSKVTTTAISWDGATLSGTSSINFKVTDAVNNNGAVATQAYELDTAAPTAPSTLHIVSNNTTVTLAKLSDTITVTALVDSDTTVTGTIGGQATTTNAVVGTTATLTRILTGIETEGTGLNFTLISTDAAGNNAATITKTAIVDGSAVETDFTAPSNQDAVFAASTSKSVGATVTIVSSGDATNNVWLAPAGTLAFVAGANMTTAGGTATSILAPTTLGDYKLFMVDAAGNISTASLATLTVTTPASSAKAIATFSFSSLSITGTINESAHTVTVNVPYGTAVTSLTPTIAISASATISPLSGVTQNFTSPVTYTVTAEDLTTQTYTVTVVVASPPSGGGGGGGGYTPPTSSVSNMSISINSGSTTTNNPTVTLTIGATNAAKMAISNNADFSGAVWETFAAAKSWTLASGDGIKTVYIKFQDVSGYSSSAISDSITFSPTSSPAPNNSPSPTAYPDDTLIKSSDAPEVYVIKSGQKDWIKTSEEFIAGGYKWEDIKTITPQELAAIPVYTAGSSNPGTSGTGLPDAGFPDGTLIKIPDSFRVYVVVSQKKKWISTPEVFETMGYKWTNITVVTKTALDSIPDFEDNLIRTIGDYKVYLVVNGLRHHIPNPEIFLDYGFTWSDVKDVPPETVAKYQLARLIRESMQPTIYYLSPNGVKKWIPTPEIFTSYGNKWTDIQVISNKEMESYAVSNIMRYDGSLYLISGIYKKLIPTDAIFAKNGYDTDLILDSNKTEFDWYKTGSNVN